MPKFPLDLSSFKKIHEDENSATLEHPHGHQISIAKAKLSAKMKESLAKLPMAETPAQTDPGVQSFADGGSVGDQVAQAEEGQVSPQLPTDTGDVAAPTPAPAPQAPAAAPQGMQAPTLMGAYGSQMAGINQQQQAESQLGAAKAHLEGNEAAGIQNQQDRFDEALNTHTKAFDALYQKAMDPNSGIDPKRYMQNHSKVATAIGLILGGMGGGLTGQGNPVIQMLQNEAANDIEAQKANMNHQVNLMSTLHQHFGDMAEATKMGVAMQSALYAAKLQQAADQTADPMAKARALQAKGQLMQSVMPAFYQQAAIDAFKSGNVGGMNLEYLPGDMKARAVKLPSGQLALAPTTKDAEDTRKSFDHLQLIQKQLSDMQKFTKDVGTTVPYSANDYQSDSMRNSVVLSLNQLHDLNRLNEYEFNTYLKQVPKPGAIRTAVAQKQIGTLQKLIAQKMQAEMQNHLEGVNPQQIQESKPKFNK